MAITEKELAQLQANVQGNSKRTKATVATPDSKEDDTPLGQLASPYDEPVSERILFSVVVKEPGTHIEHKPGCVVVTLGKEKFHITIKQVA